MKNLTRIGTTLCLLATYANAAPATLAPGVPSPAALQAFVEAIRPEAERQGISRPVFDEALAGITPDPSLAGLTRQQPEFAKPIGAYLGTQVTPSRIAVGRSMLERWRADLARIEQRYQVPASVIVAVWGLETNYGASFGKKDVIRSIATLAGMNYRPDLYRAELLAALKMLQDGDVKRSDLRGSWAGAMGQPQFMPSSFERYRCRRRR